jgi:hypothetical protein
MESGELKFLLCVISALLLCLTVFAILIFVALWPYRVLVAVCLLIVLVLFAFSLCVVIVRGKAVSTPPTLKQERMEV